MATKRTYGDGCAAAHALDLVGERWALLIVRELLCGPKRFSDLRRGLPNASPNVLSQRLHELEDAAVLRRRRLGPPVSSWVYELTEWGAELEPVVTHLGRWGRRSPQHRPDGDDVGPDSLMLALRSHFDPALAAGVGLRCTIRLGEDAFVVSVHDGRLEVYRGEAPGADVTVETDPPTFAALLFGRRSLEQLTATGDLRLTGDLGAVEDLLSTQET
jgi:DNA-binding HxlR family transcriptional regulator